jgi:hypothetical protein
LAYLLDQFPHKRESVRTIEPMKSQSPVIRFLSVIVAGWFLATMGLDAFGAHRCPHHDAVPGEARASTSNAGHAEHGVAAEGEQDGAHDSHGPCTCVGQCSMSGGVALASRSARVQHAVPQGALGEVPSSQATLLRRSLPYLTPFATAPPSAFAS